MLSVSYLTAVYTNNSGKIKHKDAFTVYTELLAS